MPTGRETETALAVATGVPLMRVSTTTRILRERADADGYDYWLRAGRGIRDAATQPHHINNALIALMVQPSDGPALVQRLRSLKLISTMERRQATNNLLTGVRSYTERLESFQDEPVSLGLLLDKIMLVLSGRRRAEDAGFANLILQCTPMVRIRLTGTLSAEVVWPRLDGQGVIIDNFALQNEVISDPDMSSAENGLFDRIIEISADQFRRMAEIVGADDDQPTLIPERYAASEEETAAFSPARDQNAAALNDQLARTELGDSHSHDMGEREKSQSSSEARTGRFHHSYRSDIHVRRRHDSPAGAAA